MTTLKGPGEAKKYDGMLRYQPLLYHYPAVSF